MNVRFKTSRWKIFLCEGSQSEDLYTHIPWSVKCSHSGWGAMSWASRSVPRNLASSNEHYRRASRGTALLIVPAPPCEIKQLCARPRLPQVKTKTSNCSNVLKGLLFRNATLVGLQAHVWVSDPCHKCAGWRREGKVLPSAAPVGGRGNVQGGRRLQVVPFGAN